MTASEMHWAPLTDRDLLDRAEAERFDALVTTDRNLKHQQNLAGRRIAILALSTTSWPRIQKALPAISDAVDRIREGAYIELLVD